MHNIKFTHLLNAGLLIETESIKIMIDGIYLIDNKKFEWSNMDDKLMNNIIYGNGIFKDINYLLFTHQHFDHFSLLKTKEYLKNNKVEKLVVTELNDDNLKNDILIDMKSDLNVIKSIDLESIKLHYFKTKHLGNERFDINHYSFIISIDKLNILYLGDANFGKEELSNITTNYNIDILIGPFIMINSILGRKFIKNLSPNLLIINHLPSKVDDVNNYRDFLENNIHKYKSNSPKTIIFQNTYDNILI